MSARLRDRLPPRGGRAVVPLRRAWWLGLALIWAGPFARAETLTLADCLRETMEHNPLIIQNRLALEQAAGSRLVFHARPFPTLLLGGLGGEQGRQTTEDVQVRVKGANGKSVTVNELSPRPSTLFLIGSEALYQPIFDAAIPASWRRGNVELAVARSNFLVVATTELFTARVQFYTAFYQQEDRAVLQAIGGSLAGNFQGQTELLNAGLGTRQAVLAAQVQQVNFQPQILINTGSLRTTLTSLLQTMGRPLGAGAAPEGSITLGGPWDDGPLTFDAAAVAKESRARRPDLVSLRELIRSYTEDANIARGGYYPLVRVYVTGELLPQDFVQGQRTSSVRPEDNTQESQISPGVRYDWNVIDTGAVRGNVRRIESLRATFSIALHHLEEDIPSELALVRAQFANAAKQRDLYQTNIALAGDDLEMMRSGVERGINSQLEFLDAQTGVSVTRSGLLAAQLRLSLAHAEYDRVIGGYLRFIDAGKPAAAAAPK